MHTSFLLHTVITCYLLNSQTDFNELLCGISITHGFGLIYKPDAAKNEIIQSDSDFQCNPKGIIINNMLKIVLMLHQSFYNSTDATSSNR